MAGRWRLVAALLAALLALARPARACTTIIVSGKATKSGAPMLAHTVDCWDCDNRVALVPSRDHPPGTLHHVFGIGHQYPRITSDKRAWIYRPQPGEERAPILGLVPEANHTYALWEANYALMNEHGLAVGESSSAASYPQGPGVDLADPKTGKKGEALFSIAALITLMVSRCKTARCAIQTAGDAAEDHGFYGEGWTSGETLTIVDATGEAWVFHVAADPTHKSAYWAAQRVPDGHLVVVANSYVIREIDRHDDGSTFMFSRNLFTSTVRHGLWDGAGAFDWCKVIGNFKDRPWYTSTRLYSVMRRVSPSSDIQPNESPLDYPWSVPVDAAMGLEDMMALYRTFYEGTEFDMTRGALAGVFGVPYRLEIGGEGGSSWPDLKGQFARGLSIPRNAYCIIAHPVPEEPLVFLNMDMPATGVFVPFLARTLMEASLEERLEDTMKYYAASYATGLRTKFSRDSAWWAFNFVANWMNINFKNMSHTYVYPAVAKWQPRALAAAAAATTFQAKKVQEEVVEAWWELADTLVIRYNDGYLNFPEWKPDEVFTIGYDEDWLRQIGYDNTFVRPQNLSCKHVNQPPDAVHGVAMDDVMPDAFVALAAQLQMHPWHLALAVGKLALLGIFFAGLLVGKWLGGRRAPQRDDGEEGDFLYKLAPPLP